MQLYLKPNPQTRVSNMHPEKQNVQALQPISTGGNSWTFTGASDSFSSPARVTSVWDSSMLVLLVCTCRWMLLESKLASSIVSVPCRVRWMAEDASEFMSLWNYRQTCQSNEGMEMWGNCNGAGGFSLTRPIERWPCGRIFHRPNAELRKLWERKLFLFIVQGLL